MPREHIGIKKRSEAGGFLANVFVDDLVFSTEDGPVELLLDGEFIGHAWLDEAQLVNADTLQPITAESWTAAHPKPEGGTDAA